MTKPSENQCETIILMPGLDGTGISFDYFISRIPKEFRVIIVKYPPDQALTFDETVAVARQQIPDDCHEPLVIAESFSGPVAVQLVALGLIRPSHLVLCATFARSPRPWLLGGLPQIVLQMLLSIPVSKRIFRLVIEKNNEIANPLHEYLSRCQQNVESRILAHRLQVIQHVDVRDNLQKIEIPCLYIQALSDALVPSACLSDFETGIRNLEVAKIKSTHFILQTQMDQAWKIIREFISKH